MAETFQYLKNMVENRGWNISVWKKTMTENNSWNMQHVNNMAEDNGGYNAWLKIMAFLSLHTLY